MNTPGPNEPCHCGSGRKYKRCCSGDDRAVRKRSKRTFRIVLIVLAVVALGVALEAARRNISTDGPGYKYDAANDRYWHTEHGHWHDGPPPDFDVTSLDPADLPEPWYYDPGGDRHWHPDHQHWHDGFPPADQATVPSLPGQRLPAEFVPQAVVPPVAPPPRPVVAEPSVSEQPGESVQE